MVHVADSISAVRSSSGNTRGSRCQYLKKKSEACRRANVSEDDFGDDCANRDCIRMSLLRGNKNFASRFVNEEVGEEGI